MLYCTFAMKLEQVTLSGDKLREARLNAFPRKKAFEIAEMIGISKQALSDFETSRAYPSAPVLLRMAVLYQFDVRDLAVEK